MGEEHVVPTSTIVSAAGIVCVFLGSLLLFLYNPPSGSFEDGVYVHGPYLAVAEDSEADEEVLDEAGDYVERAKIVSRVGFGLIAVGAILQLVSLLLLQSP